eukprot:CAMPEP_0206158252 /NCGR_PEP_ID=MMETSP1474-20131121/4664_1 /ASSEMBLY_ACC=CAM_ASM_001110 /TAXON_ID=97495 /ORGANISM="Imantonia sp., Strain RCC918" /LENGTH=306 /DNA_ID=CAMNT_0053558217 /DNA_START=167 /DNA_END=1087 /DNA_ORIENTATION=+
MEYVSFTPPRARRVRLREHALVGVDGAAAPFAPLLHGRHDDNAAGRRHGRGRSRVAGCGVCGVPRELKCWSHAARGRLAAELRRRARRPDRRAGGDGALVLAPGRRDGDHSSDDGRLPVLRVATLGRARLREVHLAVQQAGVRVDLEVVHLQLRAARRALEACLVEDLAVHAELLRGVDCLGARRALLAAAAERARPRPRRRRQRPRGWLRAAACLAHLGGQRVVKGARGTVPARQRAGRRANGVDRAAGLRWRQILGRWRRRRLQWRPSARRAADRVAGRARRRRRHDLPEQPVSLHTLADLRML